MAFNIISPVLLGAGEATIAPALKTYRATPTGTRDLIKTIDIANNSASVAVVELFLVPDLGTAGAGNILIPSVVLAKNTIFQWSGIQVMNAGAKVQARASVAGVCVHVSGGEAI